MHNEQIHISVEPNIKSQTWKWSMQTTVIGWGVCPGHGKLRKQSVGLQMKISLLHNKVTKGASAVLGYISSSRSHRIFTWYWYYCSWNLCTVLAFTIQKQYWRIQDSRDEAHERVKGRKTCFVVKDSKSSMYLAPFKKDRLDHSPHTV